MQECNNTGIRDVKESFLAGTCTKALMFSFICPISASSSYAITLAGDKWASEQATKWTSEPLTYASVKRVRVWVQVSIGQVNCVRQTKNRQSATFWEGLHRTFTSRIAYHCDWGKIQLKASIMQQTWMNSKSLILPSGRLCDESRIFQFWIKWCAFCWIEKFWVSQMGNLCHQRQIYSTDPPDWAERNRWAGNYTRWRRRAMADERLPQTEEGLSFPRLLIVLTSQCVLLMPSSAARVKYVPSYC